MSLYYLSVTIHVLAALLWLGGMFFLAVVGAPVLRAVEPPSLRIELFRQLGERFRRVGWITISVLVVTGTTNLYLRGMLDPGLLGSASFWGTSYGIALGWKLAAVTVMIVLSAVHDFVLGPRAGRTVAGAPGRERMRRTASWMARVNAVVGVILVVAAVRLARGG
jgi:copper resistance protein D